MKNQLHFTILDDTGEGLPDSVQVERGELSAVLTRTSGENPPAVILGATGEFPEGKLNEEDDGEIAFLIGQEGPNVTLRFGKPVEWMAFPPELAIELAAKLVERAATILREKWSP